VRKEREKEGTHERNVKKRERNERIMWHLEGHHVLMAAVPQRVDLATQVLFEIQLQLCAADIDCFDGAGLARVAVITSILSETVYKSQAKASFLARVAENDAGEMGENVREMREIERKCSSPPAGAPDLGPLPRPHELL